MFLLGQNLLWLRMMKILPFLILLLTFELTLGCNPELTRMSRQQMLEKKRRGRQVTIPPECNPNIHDDTNSFGPWDCDCKISQAQNQRQIDYGHGLLRSSDGMIQILVMRRMKLQQPLPPQPPAPPQPPPMAWNGKAMYCSKTQMGTL